MLLRVSRPRLMAKQALEECDLQTIDPDRLRDLLMVAHDGNEHVVDDEWSKIIMAQQEARFDSQE
jgi:hypothetical protein